MFQQITYTTWRLLLGHLLISLYLWMYSCWSALCTKFMTHLSQSSPLFTPLRSRPTLSQGFLSGLCLRKRFRKQKKKEPVVYTRSRNTYIFEFFIGLWVGERSTNLLSRRWEFSAGISESFWISRVYKAQREPKSKQPARKWKPFRSRRRVKVVRATPRRVSRREKWKANWPEPKGKLRK